MSLQEQIRKERRETFFEGLKACIPAIIIFVAFLVFFIYGNQVKAEFDASIRETQVELNNLAVQQAQNTAEYQLLMQDEESVGVVVDLTRQVTDDTVALDYIDTMFTYDSMDTYKTASDSAKAISSDNPILDLAYPFSFSSISTDDMTSAASQQFSNFESYLVSFSGDTYYYYATIDGVRTLVNVNVNGEAYSETTSFTWLLSYGINGDGIVVDMTGYNVL